MIRYMKGLGQPNCEFDKVDMRLLDILKKLLGLIGRCVEWIST